MASSLRAVACKSSLCLVAARMAAADALGLVTARMAPVGVLGLVAARMAPVDALGLVAERLAAEEPCPGRCTPGRRMPWGWTLGAR